MEPTAQTNNQTLDSTFSSQVNPEGLLPSDVANANNQVQALHRRNRYFQLLWAVLIAIALLLVGLAAWLFLRNNTKVIGTTGVADQYSPTRVNLANTGNPTAVNLGQVNVNGNLQVLGDITAGGTISGNGGGITNINPFNIAGIIGADQLDPNVALLNRNFQTFVGTNQFFRNSSNSSSAFVVQNASSAPILSVDTAQNFVGVDTSVPSIFNFLSFEVGGNAKVDNQLLVGEQSTPSATILAVGTLLQNRSLQRTLTVQQEVSDNSVNRRIYTGSANELLVNPNVDAFSNDNIFAGSYSSIQTASGNSSNYPLLAGQFTSLSHTGSGLAALGVGQFTTVGLQSVNSQPAGNLLFGIGNASVPSVTAGTLTFYSGFTAVDPTSPLLGVLPNPIPPFVQSPGSIGVQIGLDIMNQHNGAANANIQSEGVGSLNIFEGAVTIGACSPFAPVNSLVYGNPTDVPCNAQNPLNHLQTYNGSVTDGNKLIVNLNKTTATPYIDPNAVVQITAAERPGGGADTDKPLVIVGSPGQVADLTQWQNSSGTVLSHISNTGSFAVGSSAAPTNQLTVTDTTTADVAKFNGSAGTQCTVQTGVGWSCSSDERLKTNILSIDDGLNKIMQLRGVTFNWVADPNGNLQDGFVAQEVQKVLPELVSTDSNGYLGLNKDGIIAYLVKAVQQQQTQIDNLKSNQIPAGGTSVDVLKTLADAQAVNLSGDLAVDGNVIIKGRTEASGNNRGSVVIPAGQSSIHVGFPSSFSRTPTVTISPGDFVTGQYRYTNVTATGFDIELSQTQGGNINFSWQAF